MILLYLGIGLSLLTLATFWISPAVGITFLIVSKPIIDTTFNQSLFGIRLTEVVGVTVPFIIFGLMFSASPDRSLRRMPLKLIWVIYAADILFFSLLIVYNQGVVSGASVFFRYINGFVGFYMFQAFFHQEDGKKIKWLLLALIVAGLFPMGIGLYQFLTGKIWFREQAEGLIRYIGLYHDAFTVRAYAFQTILALILFTALYAKRHFVIQSMALSYGLISLLVLFKAHSKAGFLSLALWATSWTILQKKIVALSLIVITSAVVATYYSSEVVGSITQLFHKEIGAIDGEVKLDRTFAGRWYGWREMISRWTEFHWIKKMAGSGEVALGAHNDYLQTLFHGGLMGLFIYLTLLICVGFRIIANLWKRVDPIGVAALMLFLMWLVDTIGLVPSAYPGYQWFVWGIIGLSLRLREEEVLSRETTQAVKSSITIVDEQETLDLPPRGPRARRYPLLNG